MRRLFIKTFGCKVNYSESVEFIGLAQSAGFNASELTGSRLPDDDTTAGAPVVIVNSCCVTAEAERKALQFVRRIRREYPRALILLTGCGARHEGIRRQYAEAGARPFAFFSQALDWLNGQADIHGGPEAATDQSSHGPAHGRARTFIKVQDGCTCRCSYCIIPDVRPYYSRRPDAIINEVRKRLDAGYRELVLTGVNIGHFGRAPWHADPRGETPSERWDVCRLIDAVLAELPVDARLRLSSIEPEDATAELLELYTRPGLCAHLHMPLQSGSEPVLQAMRRQYTAEQYARIVADFRRCCPDGALTTDILVGYPTESAGDFQATLDLCTELGFERVHGFPYSPRPGTPAALLNPLPRPEVIDRNRRLIEHTRALAAGRWQRFVGRQALVLVEECSATGWTGHGEAYQIVCGGPPGLDEQIGRLIPVRLEACDGAGFTGRLI
ncbi:MiaB/RimO family radical SAM methylthiotransferase [bacterium]|nr:MiaB/RimO family radical SAM methylthiotransferase [bacterium]